MEVAFSLRTNHQHLSHSIKWQSPQSINFSMFSLPHQDLTGEFQLRHSINSIKNTPSPSQDTGKRLFSSNSVCLCLNIDTNENRNLEADNNTSVDSFKDIISRKIKRSAHLEWGWGEGECQRFAKTAKSQNQRYHSTSILFWRCG